MSVNQTTSTCLFRLGKMRWNQSPGKSYRLTNDILMNTACKNPSVLLLLDSSVGFDMPDHSHFLERVEQMLYLTVTTNQ